MQPIIEPRPHDEPLEARVKRLIREWAETRLRSGDDLKTLYDELLQQVEPPLIEAALQKSKGECLAASRWLHLGKGTVMGLGQLRILPLPSGQDR